MSELFNQLAARMVADLVRDYKLLAFQAAAFPGNAGEESGGFTKLQEQNPRAGRGGLGFFQDTGSRRVAFELWLAQNADKHYSAGDYAANYSFLVRELDGPEAHVLAPLRATRTIEEATEVVMRIFERPDLKTAHLEVRIDYARKALVAFVATGLNENELRAQGRPGAAVHSEIAERMDPQPQSLPGVVVRSTPGHPDFDFQQLWPMFMMVMSLIQRYRQGKGEPTDALQIVMDIGQKMTTESVPTQAVVVKSSNPLTNPSVQISAVVAAAAGVAQTFGFMPPPVGEAATNMSTLALVGPLITGALGLTGVWGKVAGGALSIIGPMIGGAINRATASAQQQAKK